MLKISEEYFSTDDTAKLKKWLSDGGAGLFRLAITAEIAKLQVEASNKALQGAEHGKQRFMADADALLRQADELKHVLEHLDRAMKPEFKPFTAKISI